MSGTPLTPHEIKRTKDAWKESGYNQAQAAVLLDISRSTFQHRMQILKLKAPAVKDLPDIDRRAAQRAADELRDLRATIRRQARELNDADDLRATVFGLAKQDTTPPDWLPKVNDCCADTQVPILDFSDFHLGEYVNAEELDGINAFNKYIAAHRYRHMIEKTISLARNFMGTTKPNYPGIIYLRNGDLVAGDIHDLKETNDLKAQPAVRELVKMERWGIQQLQQEFGHVWTISTPGNHGRDTVQPHSKENAARNFDTLSAYMLEMAFESNEDCTFWTPESGDALFNVLGYTFLATHGDRIGTGGGRGFVGTAAPIARGAKKLTEYYAALGTTLDYILLGHFHTRMEIDNTFANGCLCGYTQYGKQFRFIPVPPEQWLLFVNAKHGVTARWAMQFASRPRIIKPVPFEPLN